MDSPRPSWSWKEGFRFALCWKLLANEPISSNRLEIFGSWIIEPLYKILDLISRHLRSSLTIVLFTLITAFILGIVFYNIPAFIFLGKIFPAKVVRFFLFVLIELLFLGMGCKAFGRFHNQTLVALWNQGKLTTLFPGEKHM